MRPYTARRAQESRLASVGTLTPHSPGGWNRRRSGDLDAAQGLVKMLGFKTRRNTTHRHYRTPDGQLVEAVRRHGRPSSPEGVWLTVEDSDHRRHDYPAQVLEEVRFS